MEYKGYKVNQGIYHDHNNGGVVCECCLSASEDHVADDRWEDSKGRKYRKVRKDSRPRACWSCMAMIDEAIREKEERESWDAEMAKLEEQ